MAMLFGTTNPDGPYHWFKKNFIDRIDELNMVRFKFGLEDNPFLDPTYIEELKKEYVGLWYKRFILGLWVLAAGAVYDMWDEDKHVKSLAALEGIHGAIKPYRHIVDVDYGTSNATTFSHKIFFKAGGETHVHTLREYYHDGREAGQKTDAQYLDDLAKFMEGIPGKPKVIVDPSAASFKVAGAQRGFYMQEAKNDVIDGIRTVSTFLGSGRYTVDPSCKETLKGYASYVWDEKAQKRGEDKPLKENDHTCFAGDTMVFTDHGYKPIKDIKPGEFVLTRQGYKEVIQSGKTMDNAEMFEFSLPNNRTVWATPDHPVYREKTMDFAPIGELMESDTVCMLGTSTSLINTNTCQKKSYSEEYRSEGTRIPGTNQTETTSSVRTIPALKESGTYTGQSMLCITEPYQKDITYTISTVTPLTTTYQIYKQSRQQNTLPCTQGQVTTSDQGGTYWHWIKPEFLPQSGTEAKRVGAGTQSNQKECGILGDTECSTVRNARENSKRKAHNQQSRFDSALISASPRTEEGSDLMTKLEHANTAKPRLRSINTASQPVAPALVVQRLAGVKATGRTKRGAVYNLTVRDQPEFFAEGLLVHNCDRDRYGIFTETGSTQWLAL